MIKPASILLLGALLSGTVADFGKLNGILSKVENFAETSLQCVASVAENIGSAELLEPILQGLGIHQNVWNCNNDCVCIHGYAQGTWVKSPGKLPYCICSDDPTPNEIQVEDQCSEPQFALIIGGVCATQATCDADCRCAHKAQNGTRVLNSDRKCLHCRCNY